MRPPYRVPTMAEIAGVRGTNGYRVASSFSGCGGSCLGFEMAGFEVGFASEFVPAARETYAVNHPGVYLDGRDVRQLRPEEVLEVLGLAAGELDVFEGSPPCSPFSTAGRGSEKWGKVVAYSDVRQRVDDLFDQYIRLVAGLRPRVFVAENVPGLVRGAAAIAYFRTIVGRLSALGYRVEARVLDAQLLGVPQVRRRLILIGVREDLGQAPRFPTPLPYRYALGEAIADLGDAPVEPETAIERFAIGREWKKLGRGEQSERYFSLVRPDPRRPCPTITTSVGGNASSTAAVVHPTEPRKFSLAELRRICGFPDDFALPGGWDKGTERLGRAVPPPMMFRVASAVREVLERWHTSN